ncbi:MAG: TRAP transporter large permease [Clostridiales bacterium]|nr:TRAP transporter large permease [Clostridiales bacterium]
MELVIALLILVITMVIGVPVALSFVASCAYMLVATGTDAKFLLPYGFSRVNSIVLLTLPMFILAGALMEHGGIGKKLISAVERLVGTIKGGLAVVTIISCAVFGAISGSSAATLTCIGSIMAPRLKENGYPEEIVGALIASASVLGVLIPPSTIMILYSWTSNTSVLACFLATAVPGIVLATLFSVSTYFMIRKNPNVVVYTKEELRERTRAEKEERKRTHEPGAFAAVLMPVIILGSIYGGILTPTEAAAISVAYALPVGWFIYKKLNFSILRTALTQAATTTGVIMLMMITVQMLSRLYTQEQLPQMVLKLLTSISSNPQMIMLMVNFFMIILGMLMDDSSAVLLATPILVPVVTTIGYSPIHFAAILAVNLGLGCVTPPTAPLLYLSGRITNTETRVMLLPTLKYIVFAWLPTLILTTYIPQISMFLPTLMGYGD